MPDGVESQRVRDYARLIKRYLDAKAVLQFVEDNRELKHRHPIASYWVEVKMTKWVRILETRIALFWDEP